jgi:peptide deformylase
MALREIIEFPDPRLRTIAADVDKVDEGIKALIEDMFETMYEAGGIGLAATQINVHQRIVVMDLSEERDTRMVFINPKVTPLTEQGHTYQEGCLSVPGFYEDVVRPERCKIEALNEKGEAFEMDAEGLLAVCIQHELDHLNGKLFVDYLSSIKRERIRKKLEKEHRRNS